MRRWLYLGALCLGAACSDPPADAPDGGGADVPLTDVVAADLGSIDAGTPDVVSTDAGTPDAGSTDLGPTDAGTPDAGLLAACLERPDELPRPPTDRLPCDLLPPSF